MKSFFAAVDGRPLTLALVDDVGTPIVGEDGEPITGRLVVSPRLVGAIPRPLTTNLIFEEVPNGSTG
jgi:hypothetical protein